MQIKLTDEQKAQLEKRHKVERDKQVCDRIKAVLLRSEKWSYDTIGQVLRLDNTTVKRYLKDYIDEEKIRSSNESSDI
jgi:predicted ArsR family transcriptional regulator